MSDLGRRFDPAELDDDGRRPPDAESAGLLATARDLEAFARSEHVTTTTDFEDRVMAIIATEPPPRPIAVGGGIAGLLFALRDAWRITWTGGRPVAVRAQAFALVLIAVVAMGSVGSLATVGVARLLVPDVSPAPTLPPAPSPSPRPSVNPSPSLAPRPSPSVPPSVSPTPSPTETNGVGGSNGPTDDPGGQTQEPDETPEPTDDPSGSGSGDDRSGSDSGSGSGDDSSGSDSGSRSDADDDAPKTED